MNKLTLTLILLLIVCLTNCSSEPSQPNQTQPNETIVFKIKNLTDQDYPDNPDIGFRSKTYDKNLFDKGVMSSDSHSFHWNFSFITKTADTITVKNLNISEFIPTIPEHIKPNDYLSYISCVNQEWNRNQVKFVKNEFETSLNKIVRIDIARNCLNSYLWEIIIYIKEDEKIVPYSHGWFDFPHDLYAELFEKKNNVPYAKYKSSLENWIDPESEKIDLSLLREVIDTVKIDFQDVSDKMYPLTNARKKKYKEIIYPDTFSTMRDLQSDSTQFATFSPPGIYNKKEPRRTELGRIYNLKDIKLYKVKAKHSNIPLYEFQLKFLHKNNMTVTQLIIGGVDFEKFPILNEEEANIGWKSSMGIGNHPFYESYKDHLLCNSKTSPYYALFLDEGGKWLDSHKIGIDGPIFHFSDDQKKTLHLWLLSFERHALVGHYNLKTINQ